MPREIIRIRTRKPGVADRVKGYFRSPLNTVATVLLAIGIFLLLQSGNFHPLVVNPITQTSSYQVTPNVTTEKGFTLFPGKTTFVTFIVPVGKKVNYSLTATIEETVKPTLNNPGGVKIISKIIANGTAEPGSSIAITDQNLTLALGTYFYISSENGGTYNMTVRSLAYFNTTMSFQPAYAVSGVAITAGSSTVLASVAGLKTEEF